jgi:hypothetical protein
MVWKYDGEHAEDCIGETAGYYDDFTLTILNRYECAVCSNRFYWRDV